MKSLCLSLALLFSTQLFGQAIDLDWAINFGDHSHNRGFDIILDSEGNSYTTGNFYGTVDFDPGPGVFNLTSNGEFDIYLQKLDAQGNFLWAIAMGSSLFDSGESVTVDKDDNVLLTGYFQADMDADPGAGTHLLNNNGGEDIFIVKFSSTGQLIWGHAIGSTNSQQGNCVITDSLNNVYITGEYSNTVDFDPGIGTFNLSSMGAGSYNVYILKLDATGGFQWVKELDGPTNIQGSEITIDPFQNIIISGLFGGIVDMDPGPGIANINSDSTGSFFLLKLDYNGNYIWAKEFGSSSELGNHNIFRLTTDQYGSIYTAGEFIGNTDFKPGPGVFALTSQDEDAFVHKLDSAGNFEWVNRVGGIEHDRMTSVYIDTANFIYLTGAFQGTADLDPSSGVELHTSNSLSGVDLFIIKLDSLTNFVFAEHLDGGSSTLGNDLVVDDNYDIRLVGQMSGVCDLDPIGTTLFTQNSSADPFTAKYNQCHDYHHEIVNACESYTWIDGNTYSASGTYRWTGTNVNGCDSVEVIDLIIHPIYNFDTVVTACVEYTWRGETYTTSGIYTDSLSTITECDSIFSLDLTILPVDVSVNDNSPVLTANQDSVMYQWVDCENDFAILAGDTNQVFTALENGQYAVIIDDGTCVDTSECILVDNVSIIESVIESTLVYPNPTTGVLIIQFKKDNYQSIQINDVRGKVLYQNSIQPESQSMELDLEKYSPGVYFLTIEGSDKTKKIIRVLKE